MDVILGMDWLSSYYALVDCKKKRVTFSIPGEEEFAFQGIKNRENSCIISAMKAHKLLAKGAWPFWQVLLLLIRHNPV